MIGSTIWVFDSNRRVYPKPKPGEQFARGGPIWREHWRPCKVVAETSRSWVLDRVGGGLKVPKNGADSRQFAFSQEEIDLRCWMHENQPYIERAVSRVKDYKTLRAVADLIGYVEQT